MIQLVSGVEVDHFRRVELTDGWFKRDWPAIDQGQSSTPKARRDERTVEASPGFAECWPEAPKSPARRKKSYSLRSMELSDLRRAMKIVADNFRGEIGLVARSYMWHFSRRAGFGEVGAMWTKRSFEVSRRGGPAMSFDLMSSFVHDRDVAWVDLGGRAPEELAVAVDAFKRWPSRHRLIVVRVDRLCSPQLMDAGFALSGSIPDADAGHVYLHAKPDDIKDTSRPALKLRFKGRKSVASDCDFGVVERDGAVLGLTGVYQAEFWRDVTWGAWGAVDRASARRDAVFEILRLTEERARATGAQWFCLETSDSEKYRHARRIYELHGLELLMCVPGFYQSSDGTSEALLIYGKSLAGEKAASLPAAPPVEVALAA